MKKALIILIPVLFAGTTLLFVYFTPRPQPVSTPAPTSSASPVPNDKIRITAPSAGELVKSPFTVRGEARGPWYFEASFPVRLYDANGKELLAVPAQAQGDWMTTEFVPFEVVITFTTPATQTGTMVFQKDNPSGLPEYDDSVSIPVKFY